MKVIERILTDMASSKSPDEPKTAHGKLRDRVLALLYAYDAKKLTETKGANGRLHWYLAKGQIFILQEYSCGGAEVFAALTTTNSAEDLIEALRKRLIA